MKSGFLSGECGFCGFRELFLGVVPRRSSRIRLRSASICRRSAAILRGDGVDADGGVGISFAIDERRWQHGYPSPVWRFFDVDSVPLQKANVKNFILGKVSV